MDSVRDSIYLVAPKPATPYFFGAEVYNHWGLPPTQWIADVALATIAALASSDFDVIICDETISPVDFDTSADFVGITGKITQRQRMIEIASAFRKRGKTVIIGGPCASLSPDSLRDHCDILVRGEIEGIASALFADLRLGRWKDEYVGGRPDLALSPTPKWDIYPNDRTVVGAVQTSRGCPFECEFCDVIAYLGRKQRHKPIGLVLHELDVLYKHGYRDVFLSDDNFTVYRRRTKALLAALRSWNEAPGREWVRFYTQASIDAAKDEELLRMCGEAGVSSMFVGIETPNEESLRETKKRQNLLADPAVLIDRFLANGIMVWSGMMVGFDSDGPDIFERQFDFAMASPIPLFSLGAVVAPEATPLHARLRDSGRLLANGPETAVVPWETNIVPVGMTREQMSTGMQWLANRLYHPKFFGERLFRFIGRIQTGGGPLRQRVPRGDIDRDTGTLLSRFLNSGSEEKAMAKRIYLKLVGQPALVPFVHAILLQYAQVRCVYDFGNYWRPELAELAAPPFRTIGKQYRLHG